MFVHFNNRLLESVGIYLVHKLKKGRYKDMIPTNKEEAKKPAKGANLIIRNQKKMKT